MNDYVKSNILLVDDNPENIIMLRDVLKCLNVNVIEVNSGKEALRKVEEIELALAFIDMEMPEMNETGFARLVQKNTNNKGVPIIFITSCYCDFSQIIDESNTGIVDYLYKPINPVILFNKIKMFLEMAEQQRQLNAQKDQLQVIYELEEKYKMLVERSLQGVVVIVGLKIVFANSSFAYMTGYTIDELKSFSEEQLSTILDIDHIKCCTLESESIGMPKEETGFWEHRGYRKDGAACWFQISAHQILSGGKTATQVTIIDITKEKQAENALIKSESMYQTLLNASPEGILIINLKGFIVEVSSIALEIFGTENKRDLIGKHFMRFILRESRKKVRDVIEKTMAEGLEQDVEFFLTKMDQKQFIGEISTTLIQESNGMPRSFMAIIRDISLRKEMEKQLIHTERMAALGEMAAGIAHEINQPLNTISISLENMLQDISKNKNENDNDYLKGKINRVFENIDRASKIIDHVRAFSRDHDEYIPAAFDINESIRNALSMFSVQCKHKGIDLITDLDFNLSTAIGHTFRFEQVILNLIINAEDALEERGLNEVFDKKIRICSFQHEDKVCVEIIDNGIGIKKEDIGNIMLPFYTTKDEGKGTGMGLSISFGIIKEMKGNIEIQSEVLKGTTVQISIPVAASVSVN
jgi:PAS domain S-box-containing protein